MNEIYDLIIIGGGPGGYAAAIAAAKKNKKVIMFEKKYLGGTCLNVGCIPTKYLLDKCQTMKKITTLTEQGIFKDAGLYSFKKIQEGKKQVVEKLVSGISSLLEAHSVTVISDTAELVSPCTVRCSGREYRAKDIIVATGSRPSSIPVPGAEYTIDSTAALALKAPPPRMLIIGGGVIGMELASAYRAFGTTVTVVEMQEELFPGEERTLIRLLTAELKKSGIRIITGARITAIQKLHKELELQYTKDNRQNTLLADTILTATGRNANLQGIDAAKLGIKLGRKGEILVDNFMQTSLPHVYAIGDVTGGYQLAHAAYAEGACAVNNILGMKKEVNYTAMPRCIYTLPNYAAVGMTSQKAEEAGHKVMTGSFSYSENGMALAKGATGMVLVIADQETTETLGVHLLGESAPEMVAFAAAAVDSKMTLQQWDALIVAHPSLSEMLREAALDCAGEALHKL